MSIKIRIEKQSQTPAYRQIIQQITSLIRSGELKPGDKLPTERDLAAELKIARGTIKRAYEALSRDKIIEAAQGRGSFVSHRQDVFPAGRKERAVALIDRLLDELKAMKFSYREVQTVIDLKIMEREERLENFHVAAVDDMPEALAIFERQLGYLSQVKVTPVLLDELDADPRPEERLKDFALILTTTNHYSELIGRLPNLQPRILQVAVSPSQETIIEMAGLSRSQRMGVVCQSEYFLRTVTEKLKGLDLISGSLAHLSAKDEARIPRFLEGLDVVFVPPGYLLQKRRENVAAVQAFTERGGKVIPFDYQIERGSLLHVDERIGQLLSR
jgi:DNA-binding transcriptional regulator YhcF (GntR family)